MKMKNYLIDKHNMDLLEKEDYLNDLYYSILFILGCDIVVEQDQYILEYENRNDWKYFKNEKDLRFFLEKEIRENQKLFEKENRIDY